MLFAFEVAWEDADLGRLVEVGIAELLQVVVVRVLLDPHHRHHQLGQLVLVHVDLERVGERVRVDAHGIADVREHRSHLARKLRHVIGHVVLDGRRQLGLQDRNHLCGVVICHAVGHDLPNTVGSSAQLLGDRLRHGALQFLSIDCAADGCDGRLAFRRVEEVARVGPRMHGHPSAHAGDEAVQCGPIVSELEIAHHAVCDGSLTGGARQLLEESCDFLL